MSIEDKLTILLTLKDHALFTFRWMCYANYVHFPFKVLIADGGADESVPEILANRANFPNVKYEYIRYPYDETLTQYYAKVVDVLGRVETPFVAIADNDDFFLVDGLKCSVEFLQCHSDFSSCRGVIGGVSIKPNVEYGELSQIYGSRNDVFFAEQTYPPGSTLEETAAQRVQHYFASFRTTWYNVFRTELMLENFLVLQKLNTKDLILASHVPELLGVVDGKVYRGLYPYLVRQVNNPGSSDKAEIREKGDHFDRMLLESWSTDITGFIDAVAGAISQKDGSPIDETRRLVKRGYRNYMSHAVVDGLLDQMSPTNRIRMARDILSRMGQVYRFLRNMVNAPSLSQYISARRFIASHAEFREIFEFLINSPSIEVK
jgi:glycosyltransferase domain-containing protein